MPRNRSCDGAAQQLVQTLAGTVGVSSFYEPAMNLIKAGANYGWPVIGFGVNSDAGVVGNVVVDERNFDWTRIPTSWEDVRSGAALRGAGQRFRIDASPGSSRDWRPWFC